MRWKEALFKARTKKKYEYSHQRDCVVGETSSALGAVSTLGMIAQKKVKAGGINKTEWSMQGYEPGPPNRPSFHNFHFFFVLRQSGQGLFDHSFQNPPSTNQSAPGSQGEETKPRACAITTRCPSTSHLIYGLHPQTNLISLSANLFLTFQKMAQT